MVEAPGTRAFFQQGPRITTSRLSARTGRIWQTLPMPGECEQERDTRGDTPRTAESHGVERTASHESVRANAEHRREIGGPRGPEPTRFGDWERAGRCIDF